MTDINSFRALASRRQPAAALGDVSPTVRDGGTDGDENDEDLGAGVVGQRTRPEGLDDSDLRVRQERLEADAEIIAKLTAVGFTGPLWETLQDELVKFGVQRLMQEMTNKKIFSRSAKRGYPRTPTSMSFHDCEDLAEDTVSRALEPFRRVLQAGAWDQSTGASLAEFFFGYCVPIWANVFDVWHRQRVRTRDTLDIEDEKPAEHRGHVRSRAPGPEQLAVQRQTIREGLAEAGEKNPRLPAALVLTEDGYRQTEIADMLETTPRAIEGVLRRHRENLKSEQERDGS